MRELHLFAGAGGGVLGGMLCGHTCVCAVEIEEYPRRILLERQRDGSLPRFPIWDDIKTFDGTPWRGRVDVVAGGFPCQDITASGSGKGITGARSGLWKEMARVIDEIRPRYVFLENSPMLIQRGLAVVLGDLAEMGYDARWCVMGADHVGAPQHRRRLWLVAENTPGRTAVRTDDGWYCRRCGRDVFEGCECDHGEWQCGECGEWTYPFHYEKSDGCQWCGSDNVADANSFGSTAGISRPITQQEGGAEIIEHGRDRRDGRAQESYWAVESNVGRVVDGMAGRVDRLKVIGNGQVPLVAALAWTILVNER